MVEAGQQEESKYFIFVWIGQCVYLASKNRMTSFVTLLTKIILPATCQGEVGIFCIHFFVNKMSFGVGAEMRLLQMKN